MCEALFWVGRGTRGFKHTTVARASAATADAPSCYPTAPHPHAFGTRNTGLYEPSAGRRGGPEIAGGADHFGPRPRCHSQLVRLASCACRPAEVRANASYTQCNASVRGRPPRSFSIASLSPLSALAGLCTVSVCLCVRACVCATGACPHRALTSTRAPMRNVDGVASRPHARRASRRPPSRRTALPQSPTGW